MIKAEEIEPLIIHDVTIRAKKKSTHWYLINIGLFVTTFYGKIFILESFT